MQNSPIFKTVILSAPCGWGKSHHEEALLKMFGLTEIVDMWSDSQEITVGALHLTNVPPTYLDCVPKDVTLVFVGWHSLTVPYPPPYASRYRQATCLTAQPTTAPSGNRPITCLNCKTQPKPSTALSWLAKLFAKNYAA